MGRADGYASTPLSPTHTRWWKAANRHAREHRGMDRLHHAAPSSKALFTEIAQRGGNLGSVTWGLVRLLDAHGNDAVEGAIAEALESATPHLAAVRQILDRKRHERGQRPPI